MLFEVKLRSCNCPQDYQVCLMAKYDLALGLLVQHSTHYTALALTVGLEEKKSIK